MTNKPKIEEIEIDMAQKPLNQHGFWDRFWHDSRGNFVVWQKPNAYLMTWFVTFLISEFFHSPVIRIPFGWIAFGAIIVWSILEISKGVNNFRKFLGLLIFLFAILTKF